MSRSDTVILDRSVTFWHSILWSECHVLTQYNWIRVLHFDTIILKEKHIELKKCTQSRRTQFPKWFGWWHESSWMIFIWFTYYLFSLVLLILVHIFCWLSPVQCYSWVQTIIHYILVSILGWLMIPIQYMLPRTELYLCFSLFSFMEYNEFTRDFDLSSALANLQYIRFHGELFIKDRVGFSRSWHI